MNKRGFAISIVLYSVVFLIVTILYMLLGIVKNRYVINENLREQIVLLLNEDEEVIDLPPANVDGDCNWDNNEPELYDELCYSSSIPDNPVANDMYVDYLGEVYAYNGQYTCIAQGVATGISPRTLSSDYIYSSESEARLAFQNAIPYCNGDLSSYCTVNKKYKCQSHKYVCSD